MSLNRYALATIASEVPTIGKVLAGVRRRSMSGRLAASRSL